MAPSASHTLLSPAELAYLRTSLSSTPPIRPDARTPTQFRPLIAETDILPGTNGSARICFADGTEAVVGVKAEVEKTALAGWQGDDDSSDLFSAKDQDGASTEDSSEKRRGRKDWLEMSIDTVITILYPSFSRRL